MSKAEPKRPLSAFEKFVSMIARVPKSEADAVEAEEKRKRRDGRPRQA
jgi:hypothetical protein